MWGPSSFRHLQGGRFDLHTLTTLLKTSVWSPGKTERSHSTGAQQKQIILLTRISALGAWHSWLLLRSRSQGHGIGPELCEEKQPAPSQYTKKHNQRS